MKTRQRGITIVFLAVLLVAATLLLVKASEYMDYRNQYQHGYVVAKESVALVRYWSEVMNYRCVVRNYSALTAADLDVSTLPLNNLALMSLSFTSPPNPAFEIAVSGLSKVGRAGFMSAFNRLLSNPNIPCVITVSESGSTLKVVGLRSSGAAAASTYGSRSNADAVSSTLILDGSATYGVDGC